MGGCIQGAGDADLSVSDADLISRCENARAGGAVPDGDVINPQNPK